MAPAYSKLLLPHPATYISPECIRDHIVSIRHMVNGSRLTILDARKVIAWADKVLARRLSEPVSKVLES